MQNDPNTKKSQRERLSQQITIGSLIFIAVIAAVAIWKDSENTMTVFNMVLPVVATWVGTIIAFYFGRENFESATNQVRMFTQKLTSGDKAETPVTSIMISLSAMVYFSIPQGNTEKDIKLLTLYKKLGEKITRIPVLDAKNVVKYMIHESSINKYLADGGKLNDSLETFLKKTKANGYEFGINAAFIILSEKATIGVAKNKMEEIHFCKDIFITQSGRIGDPVTGWISDVILARFLEA